MAGWILRTFKSNDKHLMITLWKALVQPVLDYCSHLWSSQQLEAVQRVFTRKITGMGGYNFRGRLNKLGLYSQQRRRESYRAIYVWKILEKLVPDPTPSLLYPKLDLHTGRTCERQTVRSSNSSTTKDQDPPCI